jgi:MFS family permease
MGFQASFNQLGGMALLAVSGWLACYSWRYSFAVYGLAMVTVVFVALWLPNSAAQPAKQAQVSTGARLSPALFGLGALGMTMMAVFFVTTTDLGLFIQQEKPVFSSQRPMFSSPEELSTHLANGTVSETARAAFAASGVTLSPAAKLTEVQAKQAWQISDGTKRYSVRKEAGALVVSASLGTPALVGYALATMTLTGVVAGLVMSVLFGLLGFYLVPVGAVLMGVGYLLLAQCNHLWMIFAAMVFIGLAQGLMSPPLMLAVPKFVAANARALGVAVMSSSILFGQFVSPLLTEGVTLVSGNDGFRFRFNFLAAFLIGSAVVGALALLLSGRAKAVKAAQAA